MRALQILYGLAILAGVLALYGLIMVAVLWVVLYITRLFPLVERRHQPKGPRSTGRDPGTRKDRD